MRKHYTNGFKPQVVEEVLKGEKTIAQSAAEHGVHPNQLSKWKSIALKGMPSLFSDDQKAVEAIKAAHEQQVNELYAEIGRLTTQLAWLKKKSGIEPK
jgi:putative transposase